jgi:GT2 family glycosyltransferase
MGNSGMNVSIASVTVAYNALRVLPRQLEALSRQTRGLQEIIVVDNASKDGTSAMLAERYPQVTVLKMAENLGMAGAWAAGLAYAALERRHDWVWSFDDDSVPSEDTLDEILRGRESLNGIEGEVGILAPMPVHRETGSCYPPVLWREGYVMPSEELMGKPVWLADLVQASGCLVRREVVEKIGLPRADFFMDFFDFEYCLRARSMGFKIAVITRATFAHKIGRARPVRLLGYFRLWQNQPAWREYYISRNMTYAAWRLYPDSRTKRFVMRHLLRHAGGIVLFSKNKGASLRKMVQGFLDGRLGRLGVRFLPE